MGARFREWDTRSSISGDIYWPWINHSWPSSGTVGWLQRSDDIVGQRDQDNGLLLDKRQWCCETLQGEVLSTFDGSVVRVANACPPTVIGGYSPPDPRVMFSLPNFEQEIDPWLSRMQPGEAQINVPQLFGEAAELPDLILHFPKLFKRWGESRFHRKAERAKELARLAREALRDSGSTYLWYQFGVSPSTQDALAMLGLLEAFLHALERLTKLASGKALKRSIRFAPQRLQYEDGLVTTHTAGIVTKHNRVRVYREQSWATSRWEPLFPWHHSLKSPRERVREAMRQVLGLTPSGLLAAWWELLPWSWLVDWFAKVQQMLNLYGGNTMLLKCASLCWCRTCTVDTYWHLAEAPKGIKSVGRSFHHRVTKERVALTGVGSSYANTSFQPGLTASQAGVLGALLAQYQ